MRRKGINHYLVGVLLLGVIIAQVNTTAMGQEVETEFDSTAISNIDPPVDTSITLESEIWQPDPQKALWYSLALPGLGQIYNRSWWKTPLIYGGLGVSIWFIRENNQNYKDFRTAYSESFDPDNTNPLVQKYPNQESLRRIRDIYYKRYQLSIIATAAIYLMNGIEAYVDAHLKNFEISDDLSLQWATPQATAGITGVNMAHTQVFPVIGVTYILK